MYIRGIEFDQSMIDIINSHKNLDIEGRVTYKALRQFESIYRGGLYDNEFVEKSIKMFSRGLHLDREVAALWGTADNDFFEKHVVSRHILGHSLDDIVWVYGIEKEIISDIIDKVSNDIDKLESAYHLIGVRGDNGPSGDVGSDQKQN